jgi:2-keto-3-deoxy-6-phosphogluconate aldolase
MASREKIRKVIKRPADMNPEISRLAGELNRALKDEEIIPSIQSRLRHNILIMPKEIREASGILIFGRRIKSLVFTTDLAIIKNCDADAVFAVYPFTPQQSISDAIIRAAAVPVFTGIGGGITKGLRSVRLAKDAESQGAFGVVLNAPTSNRDLKLVATSIDIPVVITVTSEKSDIRDRLRHGASIINVAAGERTPDIVRMIDAKYPDVPIIASGGNTPESIRETIRAGANAITYTPPTTKELFVDVMEQYREKY